MFQGRKGLCLLPNGKEEAKGKENKQQTRIPSLISTVAGGVCLPTSLQSLQLENANGASSEEPAAGRPGLGRAGSRPGRSTCAHSARGGRAAQTPAGFKPARARGRGLGGAPRPPWAGRGGDPGGSAQ